MIKRLCICLSLVLFLCTMSGCQGAQADTLDTSVETHTADDRESQTKMESETVIENESSLYQTSQKTIAEMVQAPEKFEYNVRIGDPEWPKQLNFDAEIVIPEADGMDVVSINLKQFSEEEIVKIAENVFPEGYQLWSQEEIDACMQYLQEQIADYKKQIEWNESEVTEVSKEYYDFETSKCNHWIWNCEYVMDLFNAQKCTIAKDFTCISKENANGEKITVYMSLIKDDKHMGCMYIINDCIYYWWYEYSWGATAFMNNYILAYIDKYYYNSSASGTSQKWMTIDIDNQSSMSEVDVDEAVKKLLSNIGIKDYKQKYILPDIVGAMTSGQIINLSSGFEDVIIEPAFRPLYAKEYEGINIGTGTDKDTFENNKITFYWYNDVLASFILSPVIDIEDTISENIELIPFSRIEKALYDFLWEKSVQGNADNVNNYYIKKIVLEYGGCS